MCAYYYSYIGGEIFRRDEVFCRFGETGEICRRLGGELGGAKTVRLDLALFSRLFQRGDMML